MSDREIVALYLDGRCYNPALNARAQRLIADYALRTGLARTEQRAVAGEYLYGISAAEKAKMIEGIGESTYSIFWTNFGYSHEHEFDTMHAALAAGMSKCFEFTVFRTVDKRRSVVASWSPLNGTKYYNN